MRNSRLISVVLLVSLLLPMFLAPMFFLPSTLETPLSSLSVGRPNSFSMPMALTTPPELIRVAIYNEPNTTVPDYASLVGPVLTNNYINVSNLLTAAGYQVTAITMQDIQNHQLMTARYDLFVLVDSLPRENITNHVKEFWLGGGGIMALSSSIIFLCYAGIMPPEAEGTDGAPYWSFAPFFTDHNVYTRHPVTKSYQVNDIITSPSWTYPVFDWTALMGSSSASDFIRLGVRDGTPNDASIVAYDPSSKGGRAIQIPDEADPVASGMETIIVEAAQWLCPRPKARILFDLAHISYYGVDPWDTLVQSVITDHSEWRNSLVNRTYTFDKFYPTASGNLTLAILNQYDVLVECAPDYSFTAAEVTAVTSWVNNGGSLIAIGDSPSYDVELNYLMSNFNIGFNDTFGGGSGTLTQLNDHPLAEGATSIDVLGSGRLVLSGSAKSLWGLAADNVQVGVTQHGIGHIIAIADLAVLRSNRLGLYDHFQFGVNVANWASAAKADILLMIDYLPWHPQAYTTPVALALNELGVPYLLTYTMTYFNLSLYSETWGLAIVDQPYWQDWNSYLDDIEGYFDGGGRLLMSGFRINSNPAHTLWAKLGFSYASNLINPDPIYLWDSGHEIFTQPILYGALNLTSPTDFGTTGDLLTVESNGVALAGHTSSPTASEAIIIARDNLQSLYNGYLISMLDRDTDDSTYEDRFELWTNEIAYMVAPRCTLLPIVPMNGTLGFPVNFAVEIENLGLTTAVEGQITATVPTGFGSLIGPATQPFTVLPGQTEVINWQALVEGIGNFTLSFDADYHGLPGTMYSTPTATADIEGIPSPFTPPPIPGLPWWWWIAVLVVVIIVVIIIIYLVMKRRRASK